MGKLSQLVAALSTELQGDDPIDWTVSDLERSSAIATAYGLARSPATVERVVVAFEKVGEALETGAPVQYSAKARAAAIGLASIPGGRVEAVTFETAAVERTVRLRPLPAPAVYDFVQKGAVRGRVQTLSNRGVLRFTMFDLLHDKAVSCYLAEGREELMLDAWGKVAIVEGMVRRDASTGRPVSVREVTALTVQPDSPSGSYRKARGAVPLPPGGLLPEDAIRRFRDA
jgi:hypothetical protein